MSVENKDFFIDCLSQQESEYELLKSMYPDQGEIVLSHKHAIDEIHDFLANKTDYIPSFLDFKLNLQIESIKLEVFINLPNCYPKEEPDIYVSCNQLNRQSQSSLNSELSEYITENHNGEVCLYTAVSWLQENLGKHIGTLETISTDVDIEPQSNEKQEYGRFWIYSHHIYSKKKREDIISKAREMKLTGFSLPGKPGIVCIEGYYSKCNECWKVIKRMNWKKIDLRRTETFDSCEGNTFRKFSNFKELDSNMSDLAKYLNKLGLTHIFNELFGFSDAS